MLKTRWILDTRTAPFWPNKNLTENITFLSFSHKSLGYSLLHRITKRKCRFTRGKATLLQEQSIALLRIKRIFEKPFRTKTARKTVSSHTKCKPKLTIRAIFRQECRNHICDYRLLYIKTEKTGLLKFCSRKVKLTNFMTHKWQSIPQLAGNQLHPSDNKDRKNVLFAATNHTTNVFLSINDGYYANNTD